MERSCNQVLFLKYFAPNEFLSRRFGTYWKNIKKVSGYEEPKEKQRESGFWIKQENRRIFFDQLGKKLGINKYEDWYSIDVKDVIENKGSQVFHLLGPSLANVLPKIYPEYNWHPWKFKKVSVGFWDNLSQVRKFLQYLEEKLGIRNFEEWYQIKKSDVIQLATSDSFDFVKHKIVSQSKNVKENRSVVHDLIDHFGSLSNALMEAFPEHPWEISRFQKVQQGYWQDSLNQKKFLQTIGKELGVKNWTDWYSITRQDIVNKGGWGLLSNYYSGSISKALSILFPEFPWEFWRFVHTKKGSWEDMDNITSFIENAKQDLGIRDPEEWLAVPYVQLYAIGFKTLLHTHGGLIPLLKKVYPEYDWDNQLHKLSRSTEESRSLPKERIIPSKVQNALFKLIYSIFPNHVIHSDYPHPNMRYSSSKIPIQFDIFIPSLSIAFEYQGAQHYIPHYLFSENEGALQKRDEEKRNACSLAGITLYEIPYWWNLSKDALVGTILKKRPDLVNLMEYTPANDDLDARKNTGISIPQVLLNKSELFLF